MGIDLWPDGVTPNDVADFDTGPNNLQNFPAVASAISEGGSATIQGTLNSTPNTTFRLEFFANPACDSSGYGEGKTFLGFLNLTTDGSGNVSFGPAFSSVPVGHSITATATATDPNGNTSEFSQCVTVAAALAPTPTPVPGVSGLGLGIMAGLLLAAFLWAIRRRRNISTSRPSI